MGFAPTIPSDEVDSGTDRPAANGAKASVSVEGVDAVRREKATTKREDVND